MQLFIELLVLIINLPIALPRIDFTELVNVGRSSKYVILAIVSSISGWLRKVEIQVKLITHFLTTKLLEVAHCS